MGMNGDGDKTTRQNCNLNGDESKGIRKGALLLCLETPSQWLPLYFLLNNRILAKEIFPCLKLIKAVTIDGDRAFYHPH